MLKIALLILGLFSSIYVYSQKDAIEKDSVEIWYSRNINTTMVKKSNSPYYKTSKDNKYIKLFYPRNDSISFQFNDKVITKHINHRFYHVNAILFDSIKRNDLKKQNVLKLALFDQLEDIAFKFQFELSSTELEKANAIVLCPLLYYEKENSEKLDIYLLVRIVDIMDK